METVHGSNTERLSADSRGKLMQWAMLNVREDWAQGPGARTG